MAALVFILYTGDFRNALV